MKMEGVKEYAEGMNVDLRKYNGRLVISAWNQCGNDGTDVDLIHVLEWVQKNMPELLKECK